MNCMKCGAQLAQGDTLCSNCGEPVANGAMGQNVSGPSVVPANGPVSVAPTGPTNVPSADEMTMNGANMGAPAMPVAPAMGMDANMGAPSGGVGMSVSPGPVGTMPTQPDNMAMGVGVQEAAAPMNNMAAQPMNGQQFASAEPASPIMGPALMQPEAPGQGVNPAQPMNNASVGTTVTPVSSQVEQADLQGASIVAPAGGVPSLEANDTKKSGGGALNKNLFAKENMVFLIIIGVLIVAVLVLAVMLMTKKCENKCPNNNANNSGVVDNNNNNNQQSGSTDNTGNNDNTGGNEGDNTNNDNNNENEQGGTGTNEPVVEGQSTMIGAYQVVVPNDLQVSSTDGFVLIQDQGSTWVSALAVTSDSYNDLTANSSAVRTQLESSGYIIKSYQRTTYEGREFLVFNTTDGDRELALFFTAIGGNTILGSLVVKYQTVTPTALGYIATISKTAQLSGSNNSPGYSALLPNIPA